MTTTYSPRTTGRIIRTFIVDTGAPYCDEVDGRGDTPAEALADAEAQAADLYGPDCRLEEIEAGGSAGLINF